ncbi:NADH-quinone oxidoreductase subunit H [Candidatus Uhrbacteria bacterium]|nr:NADH-quinone oxidoreductase subunit H [Candidatus Uhrbacteria bacterium]
MSPLLLTVIQAVLVLGLAPLTVGLVRWFKARLQGRQGAVPWLPYVALATMLRREMVISESTSWVFRLVPFVVCATGVFLVLILPLVSTGSALSAYSHFMLVAGVLALGSVFLVLGGLDSASAFGGMGSSREMTIASLVEPAVFAVFAAFAVASGHATIDGMVQTGGAALLVTPALLFSLIALVLIALAENARYPVDNPATHLELTMVHEAMVLEYSGPYLAMVEYASALRLTVFLLLLANFTVPTSFLFHPSAWQTGATAAVLVGTFLKLLLGSFLLALLETSIVKMRFYRMQEYLSLAFVIALAGLLLTLFL